MKKNYFLITAFVLLLSSTSYGQAAKFFLDFEGVNPLLNLPSGITNVDGVSTVVVKGTTYTPTPNVVQADGSGGKELFLDYHGYLKMNLATANGFTIALDYRRSPEDAEWYLGFLTLIGEQGISNYILERILIARYWESSFDFSSTESTWVSPGLDTEAKLVVTCSNTGDIKIYANNVKVLDIPNSTSGKNFQTLTNASLLLSFKGETYDGTNVTPEADYTFNSRDTRAYVDNIALFERELSAAEVSLIYTNGNNTLSVKDRNAIRSVGMYPNPVNRDTDLVKFSSKEVKSVEIYNILGSKVMSSKVLDYAVNVSTLTSGTYIINCFNSENQKLDIVKLIKM